MDFLKSLAHVVLNYVLTIKWTDLLDVAIIAFVIYHLLVMTRRTRFGQVLKALFFILAALWISSELNLHIVYFILNSLVQIGVLALIVVFQPEVRRFLERIGSGIVLPQTSYAPGIEQAIVQTVYACRSLSQDKIGALIVFERRVLLDDIVKTGTAINADVSSELLKNIFWPKAPLHDGAVIIREGQILCAGCVLPLSGNTNLSPDLGTRHRAGIGMSEHSDAVVALVSEETGAISVAVGGLLKRKLTPETLDKILRAELLPPQDEKKTRSIFSRLRRRKGETSHVE